MPPHNYPEFNQQVLKASGYTEPFDWKKLEGSLVKSQVDPEMCLAVGRHLSEKLPPLCTTADIRVGVKKYLSKNNKQAAAHYNLREAVMKLGPSGFPFEQYIGALFKEFGFETRVGEVLQGSCVTHEVDVIALKDHTFNVMECKYHNRYGVKTDVKVALYVWARIQDIKEGREQSAENQGITTQGWLVTNTKLTTDAIHYSRCKGVKVISWNYPGEQSLYKMIEQKKFFPITSLFSLKQETLQELLIRKIVTGKQLLETEDRFINDLPRAQILSAKEEARVLTQHPS